jgi:selenocysteine lyase/cysteine desulfurase
VRASTHFYNSTEQVERLLEAVQHVAENELDYV